MPKFIEHQRQHENENIYIFDQEPAFDGSGTPEPYKWVFKFEKQDVKNLLSTYTEVGISKNQDADQSVIDSFQPSEESLENFATEVYSNLPERMISRHQFADNIFDRISKHFFKPMEYNKKKKVQSKVILLAGTSGTGKSTIATKLCLKYNLHLI